MRLYSDADIGGVGGDAEDIAREDAWERRRRVQHARHLQQFPEDAGWDEPEDEDPDEGEAEA